MAKVKGEVKGLAVGVGVGFKVLGVIDLRGGLAVRARGGRREQYIPIESVAGAAIQRGDAIALARQYVSRFGLTRLYVADLDAIEGRDTNAALVQGIASTGASVWLDSGIVSVEDAICAIKSGAERVIVGLETLPSFEVLDSICQDVGPRVIFSLDLRDGTPVTTSPALAQHSPEVLAARAVTAGVCGLIVLDLARVGSGSGIDLEMLVRIRRGAPSVPVYAGGGLRSTEEIEQLQHAGCDGALVASALLDGQITEHTLAITYT
jgi:phosphoribosylformimino-5-aminoimidazole carboxamide ribotide isomerase